MPRPATRDFSISVPHVQAQRLIKEELEAARHALSKADRLARAVCYVHDEEIDDDMRNVYRALLEELTR